MNDLTPSHVDFLKHVNSGGLAAVCIYGKKELTTEIITRPRCYGAGLKSLSYLHDLGFIRYGDASPYKSGKSFPVLLTELGKLAAGGSV
jgi:hypothetical protein